MKTFEGFRRGVNLGGWISQFDVYDPAHFASFITEDDIAEIASLGFDHVRVPVDYNVLEDEDGNPLESGFALLENCRLWCERHGLKMIIDLHECYGYSFDPLKKDMDRERFFYDDALQSRFLALWRTIAERFKAYPEQVAFEPLNEVAPFSVVDAWNAVIEKYITAVRAIAPENYLIIGGVCYNSVTAVPLLKIPTNTKIVFNFHCYEPLIFTHQGAYWIDRMPADFRIGYPASLAEYREKRDVLRPEQAESITDPDLPEPGPDYFRFFFAPAVAAAEAADVALYCGEYGVIDLADNEDKLRWLTDIHQVFDEYGIGRALWNYKQKDFGLVDKRFASIRDRFIAQNR